jgi:hypothetical protein
MNTMESTLNLINGELEILNQLKNQGISCVDISIEQGHWSELKRKIKCLEREYRETEHRCSHPKEAAKKVGTIGVVNNTDRHYDLLQILEESSYADCSKKDKRTQTKRGDMKKAKKQKKEKKTDSKTKELTRKIKKGKANKAVEKEGAQLGINTVLGKTKL